jgi:sugar lactone lactonase YvrE
VTTTDAGKAQGVDRAIERAGTSLLCAERCHLGEGPAYDGASDTAWWLDILERRLFEARLGTGAIVVHRLPVMASALAYVDDARQLVAAEDGLYLRATASGVLQRLIAIGPDNGTTRSNDSRAHPSGTYWTSIMGRKAEVGAGVIYALHRSELRRLFTGLTPNAICCRLSDRLFRHTRENVTASSRPQTGLPPVSSSAQGAGLTVQSPTRSV